MRASRLVARAHEVIVPAPTWRAPAGLDARMARSYNRVLK